MHSRFRQQLSETRTIFVAAQRKERSMKRSRWIVVGMSVILTLSLVSLPDRADAVAVTSLDFTSGAANFTGPNSRILDRLFAEDGTIKMGSFQPLPKIVDPITRGDKTF